MPVCIGHALENAPIENHKCHYQSFPTSEYISSWYSETQILKQAKTSGTSTLSCTYIKIRPKINQTSRNKIDQKELLLSLGSFYFTSTIHLKNLACSTIRSWMTSKYVNQETWYPCYQHVSLQRDTIIKLSVLSDPSQEETLFHNQWMCSITIMSTKKKHFLLLSGIKKKKKKKTCT
jgi:hypothetical protein